MEERINKFLKINFGFGDGDGDGSGSGSGDGFGDGSGSGFGDGFGDGSGSGFCDGDGSGSGSGDGSGSGSGDGDGSNILSFNKDRVDDVDGVQTIIKSVRGNIAKGFILNKDLTLTPCYIAKSGNYFAHGETLKKAVADAVKKRLNNMPIEEKIAEFRKEFKKGVKYSGRQFFDWHGKLTQSCEMGRNSFCGNKGINLDDMFTVAEFIELTKNEYGSDVIKKLAEYY